MHPLTLGELVASARRRLEAAPFRPPTREALLLAAHVLGVSEARVLARPELVVGADDADRFEALLARRLAGEPVAYLTGNREFWGRPFAVDSRVLIPRPETEHLIEEALALELPKRPWILDIGTGSGCLAVTLGLELPAAQVVATDISLPALALATRNAVRLGATNVRFANSDLAAAIDLPRFDLVVANPPYIDPADAPTLSPEILDYEPHRALFAPGGDALLRDLIEYAALRLRSGGQLLLEIGADQLADVERHAGSTGLHTAAIIRDYASFPRVVRLQRR